MPAAVLDSGKTVLRHQKRVASCRVLPEAVPTQYLLGRSFTVRTDHAALQWLRRTPEPIGQQSRWLKILEEFNFTVEHRAGKKHENADALSRRPCRQCGVCTPETSATETADICALHVEEQPIWSMEEIKRAQESDPDIRPL